MYTEYEERKGFPFRDFLIKLVLVVIFVLLLFWLLPIPNMKGVNNNVFNANVETMKDSAINYFTTERLPKNVGDKVTLTLKEMLDLKLLLPFTDKNGDTCDVNKSYVTLEKMDTEYLMTVHLKCKGQEDEIEVHLGCYSYCTGAICEKEEDKQVAVVTGPSCTLMISSGKVGENGWYVGDIAVKFKSKTTTTSGAKITNYGIGLESNYDGKDTYKVTKEGTTKVYGYVKDSKGKTAVCSIEVKKDTVKPSCNLTVLSGSTNTSGSYTTDVVVGFKSKTDATSGVKSFGVTNSSKETYNGTDKYTIKTNGTTKVYGYVKDAAGHVNTCDMTINRNAVSKTSKPSCTLEITSGTVGANSWYTSNVVVGFKSKTSTNGATITSYGIGTKATYDKNNSYTIDKDGNYTINGYVKDSNGNTATCSITVKRDATKPSCSLSVLSGTKNNSGNYTSDVVVGFVTKTDNMSGLNTYGMASTVDYNKLDKITLTGNGTYTFKGFVKDNAGNANVCNLTVTKVANAYEYEYKKEISALYSNWSNWVDKTVSNQSELPTWGLSSNGLTETKYLGKTSEWKTITVGNAIYADQLVEVPGATIRTCADYKYYKSTTNTKTTYAIKLTNKWQDLGLVSLSGTPQDTLSVKYEFVGFDWDRCGDTCTTTPYTVWRKYSRQVSTVTYTDTETKIDGVTVECSSYIEQPIINFYTFSKFVGYEQKRTLVDVYKYQLRTRSLISAAYTDVKWSSYNNAELLTAGYTMTGNYKLVG